MNSDIYNMKSLFDKKNLYFTCHSIRDPFIIIVFMENTFFFVWNYMNQKFSRLNWSCIPQCHMHLFYNYLISTYISRISFSQWIFVWKAYCFQCQNYLACTQVNAKYKLNKWFNKFYWLNSLPHIHLHIGLYSLFKCKNSQSLALNILHIF